MPSFNIHLAIGKRYIEKNKTIKDIKEFYQGIIAPDLVPDKKISHYGEKTNKNKLVEHLSRKVLLNKFLLEENIDNDYNKGIFLHLITDYLFFNNFLNKDYLDNTSYEKFRKDLYYSYNIINDYLEDKYNISYYNYVSKEVGEKIKNNIEKDKNSSSQKKLFSPKEIDDFIELTSSINLENYKNKILNNNKNILPDIK